MSQRDGSLPCGKSSLGSNVYLILTRFFEGVSTTVRGILRVIPFPPWTCTCIGRFFSSVSAKTFAVHSSFNRSEEDFEGDLLAYNNYLEDKEDLIYALTNGSKEENEAAKARVRTYQEAYRGEITKNAAKK